MKELALLKTMNLRLSIKNRAAEAMRKWAGPPAKGLAEHQLTHTAAKLAEEYELKEALFEEIVSKICT